jgi:hypothetical protein
VGGLKSAVTVPWGELERAKKNQILNHPGVSLPKTLKPVDKKRK